MNRSSSLHRNIFDQLLLKSAVTTEENEGKEFMLFNEDLQRENDKAKNNFMVITYIPALLAAVTPDGASSNTRILLGSTMAP